MKSYERKHIVLPDLYILYPYKYYDTSSSTVPFPYFSKDKITNEKQSLTYKEWRVIIETYLKLVVQDILEGVPFIMPISIGRIELRKNKRRSRKKILDKPATSKAGKAVFYPPSHILSKYCLYVKWYRQKNKFAHKYLWRFKINKKALGEFIGRVIEKDPTIINKINDV
jgi:hypothetical protein